MRDFLLDRIRLVRELLDDHAPATTYADLVLILTSVISACAALRWPGKGIDKRRFVELLICESPIDYHLSWVSVPALIDLGYVDEANTPYGHPGQGTRIFRDEQIDLSYSDARRAYATLEPKQLKTCTYAVLIYEWLRCGYAHEYCPHENITHRPPSRHPARISYIGRSTIGNGVTRMISFHLDYLIQVVEFHATNAAMQASPKPAKWWIDTSEHRLRSDGVDLM